MQQCTHTSGCTNVKFQAKDMVDPRFLIDWLNTRIHDVQYIINYYSILEIILEAVCDM